VGNVYIHIIKKGELMQKSVLILGTILMAGLVLYAVFSLQGQTGTQDQSQSLNWHYDLNSALEEAKKTNKTVMTDFYSPGCYACQLLDEDTFLNPQVRQKLDRDYVVTKININENPDLASKYKIYTVPTLILLDSGGNEIKRFEGYIPPEELLNLL